MNNQDVLAILRAELLAERTASATISGKRISPRVTTILSSAQPPKPDL